ncbi:MAG: bifunctional adenosylcobinamide kinase/adenosylcobinamide-phosphate guanylyltransferase [Chloroflexi bacterium]|nr:bifunctional adenosylcobinamide kinase/adenosylcobinamide-phosphate guanylyltransferase [Chloroflexota bacterium]
MRTIVSKTRSSRCKPSCGESAVAPIRASQFWTRRVAGEAVRIALVLGGARSGKSAFAQRLAEQWGEPVLFVATASPGLVRADPEMAARIARHQAARPAGWHTVEAPTQTAEAVRGHAAGARTVLMDCLSMLVSNQLVDEREHPARVTDEALAAARAEAEVDSLVSAARDVPCHLIVVSNEVGMGVVPSSPLGRLYRDVLGRANQHLAGQADQVYLMVAGLAVDLRVLSGPGKHRA